MAAPINRLELIITERCNSRCRHCCFRTSPNGGDMPGEDAVRWIGEAASLGSLDSLLLFGGEPMLAPRVVLAAIEAGARIPRIDMITNAFWARTEESARHWIERLSGSGLRRIVLSVDAFHAEYVPVGCVRRASEAAVAAGMRVTWNVAVLRRGSSASPRPRSGSTQRPNVPSLPDDERTWQIIEELRTISDDVNENEVLPAGRALENFAHLYERRAGVPTGPCPGPGFGGTLEAPTVITMRPNGDAEICWGIRIGNAKRASLVDIVAGYDPRSNAVIATLIEHGPAGLLELAAASGFRPKLGYVDACELCHDAVSYMGRCGN